MSVSALVPTDSAQSECRLAAPHCEGTRKLNGSQAHAVVGLIRACESMRIIGESICWCESNYARACESCNVRASAHEHMWIRTGKSKYMRVRAESMQRMWAKYMRADDKESRIHTQLRVVLNNGRKERSKLEAGEEGGEARHRWRIVDRKPVDVRAPALRA